MADDSAACTECGAALPAGARFCPQCGTRVASATGGERRPVAILFADLAGFTRLTAENDAEAIRDLLGRYFAAVDGAVLHAGGTIDKHIGDATMAVFGAPVAHGNDIERAVRAAFEIHDAMAALSAEVGRALAAHVAIASGEVVAASVGSAARNDYTVTGDAVNLASRLEELSRPGETIVSDAVRRALGDRLDVESRGTVEVRGLAGAQPVWQVRSLRDARRPSRDGSWAVRANATGSRRWSARPRPPVAARRSCCAPTRVSASRGSRRRSRTTHVATGGRAMPPRRSTLASDRDATWRVCSRARCWRSPPVHRPQTAARSSTRRSPRATLPTTTSRSWPTSSASRSAGEVVSRRWTRPCGHSGACRRCADWLPPPRASNRSCSPSRTCTGPIRRSSTRSRRCAIARGTGRSCCC